MTTRNGGRLTAQNRGGLVLDLHALQRRRWKRGNISAISNSVTVIRSDDRRLKANHTPGTTRS